MPDVFDQVTQQRQGDVFDRVSAQRQGDVFDRVSRAAAEPDQPKPARSAPLYADDIHVPDVMTEGVGTVEQARARQTQAAPESPEQLAAVEKYGGISQGERPMWLLDRIQAARDWWQGTSEMHAQILDPDSTPREEWEKLSPTAKQQRIKAKTAYAKAQAEEAPLNAAVFRSTTGKAATAITSALMDVFRGSDREPTLMEAGQIVNQLGIEPKESFKGRFFGETLPRLALDSPLYVSTAALTKGFGMFTTMNVLDQALDKVNTGAEFEPEEVKHALLTDAIFKAMLALGIGFRATGGATQAVGAELGNIATTAGVFTGLNAVQQWANNEELDWEAMPEAYLENLALIGVLHGRKLYQATKTGPRTVPAKSATPDARTQDQTGWTAAEQRRGDATVNEMIRRAKKGDAQAKDWVRRNMVLGAEVAEQVNPTPKPAAQAPAAASATTRQGRPVVLGDGFVKAPVPEGAASPVVPGMPISRMNAPYPHLQPFMAEQPSEAGQPAVSSPPAAAPSPARPGAVQPSSIESLQAANVEGSPPVPVDAMSKSKEDNLAWWNQQGADKLRKIEEGASGARRAGNKWEYNIGDGQWLPSPFGTKGKTLEYVAAQRARAVDYYKSGKFAEENSAADWRGFEAEVETPAAAAAEVKDEMVNPANPRKPSEIKKDIVAQLEDVLASRTAEHTGKVEQVEFSIPGDGTFKIWNSEANVSDLLARAKRVTTKNAYEGENRGLSYEPNKGRTRRYVKDLAARYTVDNLDELQRLIDTTEAAVVDAEQNQEVPEIVVNRMKENAKAQNELLNNLRYERDAEAPASKSVSSGTAADELRGSARVPDADGAPAGSAPDWVLRKPETSKGRKLVRQISDGDGRKASLRTVVDFVNDAVGVQMRRSGVQTSRRHPAHYRPTGHVTYTRNTQSQINFHEAGHGLKELLDARAPGIIDRYSSALVAIAKMPGSMASADNVHEGVAEWVRLRIMNPQAVDDLRVTKDLEAEIDRVLPDVGRALRDATRAMAAYRNRPAAERWSMVANAPRRLTISDIRDWVIATGGSISDKLSSGAPLSRLDRQVFRAIKKDRKSAELSLRAALKRARQTRKQVTEPVLAAHNMVLQIGQEVQKAISAKGPDRGLRVIVTENNNNYVSFFPKTWQEIVKAVPAGKWRQFQEAGWAKEALNRYEQDGLEYPGRGDGVTPDDLRNVVEQARREIKDFDQHAQTVQAFFDAVLDVKDFGGLKAEGEVERMRRRGDYWPLPRVVEQARGGVRPSGNISAGDFRARGSGEAIKGLSEVAEERVRDALTAYYWNRLGLTMAKGLRKTADDASLPWLAREIAGRALQPLKMGRKVAATVPREEALGWILPALNEQKAEELGRPLLDDEVISPDDINLSWNFMDVWRPTAPKDYNVVSFLEGGERKFFQLHDPSMFSMFASPDQAGKVTQALAWAFGPPMQNWKRNITQSLPFSINNLMGDLINQVMLNKDAVGWFPGGATLLGTINRFAKKYPHVMQEGLLLSRVEPGSEELLNQVKHNAVWQFLTEGFYVSQSRNPAAKFALTALQPSNWLYPIWKTGDLLNLITAGRYLAPRLEGATREGAAVAAKMSGKSDEEANFAYWRATGTFNEHSGSPDLAQLMRMPGFFNPYVQAARGAGRVLFDPDPAVSGAAWAKLLLVIPALFGAKAFIDYLFMDDEEKKRERERTVDDRMNYSQHNGFKMRFPYGPEGAAGAIVYNAVMDELLGVPPAEGGRKARLALNRMVGMGSPLEFLGPQIKTLTEAEMNYSTFRQRHIVSPWMNGLPESEQYQMTTPEFYRRLGRWMDYSPDKLQYIMQNALNRQTDEVIRMLDRMDSGEQMQERADLPFVGRMFVRNPNGFNSRSGQTLSGLEEKLLGLDTRLNNSGYGGLKTGDLIPATNAGSALETQLMQLEGLRRGLADIRRYTRDIKAYEIAGNQAQADNLRRGMMVYIQSLLAHNPDVSERIDNAMGLLDKMPEMQPQAKAQEYLNR